MGTPTSIGTRVRTGGRWTLALAKEWVRTSSWPERIVMFGSFLILLSVTADWYDRVSSEYSLTPYYWGFGSYGSGSVFTDPHGVEGIGWIAILAMLAAVALIAPARVWRDRTSWRPPLTVASGVMIAAVAEIVALGLEPFGIPLMASSPGFSEQLQLGGGFTLVVIGALLTFVGGWRLRRAHTQVSSGSVH